MLIGPPKPEAKLDSYFPQEPSAPVEATDNVPGTKATWADAVKNSLERVEERLPEKQPQMTV